MLNDISSALTLLRSRRSGKARDMATPGPDAAQMADIIAIATRVPDHGKLAPWRIIEVPLDARERFAAMLVTAYHAERPTAGRLEIEAIDAFARQAPTMLALLSTPNSASHIPLWEQQLSAGAMTMQLLNAAHAHGFVANWLTGWPATSAAVATSLGAIGDEERIIGFVFIGTATKALEERPRPLTADVVTQWDES
ncbi:MAG: nitroreductase [Sphingopyxis sp.]